MTNQSDRWIGYEMKGYAWGLLTEDEQIEITKQFPDLNCRSMCWVKSNK